MENNLYNKKDDEMLYPQAPRIEDVISIIKGACIIEVVEDNNKIVKYQSPELHYMIYKGSSSIDGGETLQIVCIEFAKFYLMKYDDSLPLEKSMKELLNVNSRMVAEHIRKSVFECENFTEEGLLREIQTDTMKNFWYIKAIYDFQKNIENSSAIIDDIDILSQNNVPNKPNSFLKKVA